MVGRSSLLNGIFGLLLDYRRVSVYFFYLGFRVVLVGVGRGTVCVGGVVVALTQVFSLVDGCVSTFYVEGVWSYLFSRFATCHFLEELSYLHYATKCFPPAQYPHFYRCAFHSRVHSVQSYRGSGRYRVMFPVLWTPIVSLRHSSNRPFLYVVGVPVLRSVFSSSCLSRIFRFPFLSCVFEGGLWDL